jgi:hypothetical protein
MGFLRRIFGGEPAPSAESSAPFDAAEADSEERAHELELLRSEQERLDELTQRQIRYAAYAWEPPAQGGERRADDHDASGGER